MNLCFRQQSSIFAHFVFYGSLVRQTLLYLGEKILDLPPRTYKPHQNHKCRGELRESW